MKYMRLGTKPDTFYIEEATRSMTSDVPSDLVIKVNRTTYFLHKYALLPNCGLLQRFCSDSQDSSIDTIELHVIPGGEEAFELCAKFCYGIAIDLSAYNFVRVFCAAKFLQMIEEFEKGNLIGKLKSFFHSCILQGWKDSVVTLQSTSTLPEWSENLGIIRRCIDSIVEKILTPPSKVKWSYTYTRPGYTHQKHQSTPRDWWTEDISNLNIDIFQVVVATIRSKNVLPAQLVGEALHVYACRWLPDPRNSRHNPESSGSQNTEAQDKKRRVHEIIVSLIPAEEGSVSVGFLVRLLSIGNLLSVSPVTKAALVRQFILQMEAATVEDLLLSAHYSSPDQHHYDLDVIREVVEGYVEDWKRRSRLEDFDALRSIRKVGELIDGYLQTVAEDVNVPVVKIVSLATALPDAARPNHDGLYKAIDVYLKEHPLLSKEEKRQLCRILNCQKLSVEVRGLVVKNELLPLRTIVQVLFFEQESRSRATSSEVPVPPEELIPRGKSATTTNSALRRGGDQEKSKSRRPRYPPKTGRESTGPLTGTECEIRVKESDEEDVSHGNHSKANKLQVK